MALCFSSLTVNAAPPKISDVYPQIAAPTDEEQVNSTTWNYSNGVNQLTDPEGQWNWNNTFEGKPACWGMNQTGTFIDCDLRTIYWESKDVDFSDKGATHVRQVVFADGFTQSGIGDYGRHNPQKKLEDFEQLTVIYSADGENWNTTKNFTVAYHTNANTYAGYMGKEYQVDTYWHLILDEPVPVEQCKFFSVHSSETKAWDAQDHAPSLGIILDWKYTYLVKDTGAAPELTYPEAETTAAPTEAPTEAPATEAPETEGATDGVTEAPATNAPAGNAPAESNGIDAWVWIVIGVAVVAVVVVVVIVAKKKK
jgi:hypothetical protein